MASIHIHGVEHCDHPHLTKGCCTVTLLFPHKTCG